MSLTELHRPQGIADLVGNKKQIEKLKESILSKRATLVYGNPGIGKTSSVFAIAHDLGFQVREWNASDERKKENLALILRELTNKSFSPTIYLLDEIDGADDFKPIELCIKQTRNPLVLICNDFYKIPQTLTQLCEVNHFYDPQIQEVADAVQRIAKKVNRTPNLSLLNHDIRSSINNAFYNSEKISTKNIFDELELFFKTGETKNLTTDHIIWLIDNGAEILKGKRLFTFFRLLNSCDQLDRLDPLSAIGRGSAKSKIEYPRYIRRSKVLRGKANAED